MLGSPKLAAGLLIYVGIVLFVGTLVPQGDASNSRFASWAASNPQWEVLAQRLGLHAVYTSWYFLIGVALLAASTAVCSWKRTKAARRRFGVLRKVAASGELPGRADYSIALADPEASSNPDVLSRVESALAELGVRGSRRGNAFAAASSAWSVWGSTIFHWSLVLIFCVLVVGSLFRSEGLMGVVEGESLKDDPAAYRVLTVGPLHRWPSNGRQILLNKLLVGHVVGDIDRGTVPDVSVLDGSGAVLARQVIYPNNALHLGSLTIHNSKWGLSPRFELIDKSGTSLGASSVILDFPTEATGSTEPGEIELTGKDGSAALVVRVTMPLDRESAVAGVMPRAPKAKVQLLTPEGKAVGGGTLSVGKALVLPDGSSLSLSRVSYYARLSVVDDPTIPVLYAALFFALAGVAFALLARQQLIVVEVVDDQHGSRLDVLVRLWRNSSLTSEEIRVALQEAFDNPSKENARP